MPQCKPPRYGENPSHFHLLTSHPLSNALSSDSSKTKKISLHFSRKYEPQSQHLRCGNISTTFRQLADDIRPRLYCSCLISFVILWLLI
ncbi:DUF1661 domain-containing protein [Porphyromonas gulae]|uniref:DUF1661 domain-containing protein n=1 Tax=Porphyromonas gulae TaxID=111105 RepID=UPI003743DD41